MSKEIIIKVCMCVDAMGSGVQTQEEEYKGIKKTLIDLLDLGAATIFKKDIFPYQLRNESCDLYVFDFGGMLPGCEDTVFGHFKELSNQVKDRPNTLFIIFSEFSANRYWRDAVEEEYGEYTELPNVVIKDLDGDWEQKIKEWFSHA